jgi:DNA-binding MarR family transcriptional regulator
METTKLTGLHMLVLGWIGRRPYSRPEEVARGLGLDVATTARIHRDLEAAGMIERARER